jgi:hypothetical protein
VGDSIAPVEMAAVASAITLPHDAVPPPGELRAQFEEDFSASMADQLNSARGCDECYSSTDIVVTGYVAQRRRLQAGGVAVQFELRVPAAEGDAAESAATTFQASSTPVTFSLAGKVMDITPASSMAAPSAAVAADIDCVGTWSCEAGDAQSGTCRIRFTRTQAPSGEGVRCPPEPVCECVAAAAAAGPGTPLILAGAGAGVLGVIVGWQVCLRMCRKSESRIQAARMIESNRADGAWSDNVVLAVPIDGGMAAGKHSDRKKQRRGGGGGGGGGGHEPLDPQSAALGSGASTVIAVAQPFGQAKGSLLPGDLQVGSRVRIYSKVRTPSPSACPQS